MCNCGTPKSIHLSLKLMGRAERYSRHQVLLLVGIIIIIIIIVVVVVVVVVVVRGLLLFPSSYSF
jgi:t-SNARE complex subunit (syntaxin)